MVISLQIHFCNKILNLLEIYFYIEDTKPDLKDNSCPLEAQNLAMKKYLIAIIPIVSHTW